MESLPDDFHERVRARFLELAARPHRYLVVDAGLGVDEIQQRVRRRAQDVLPISAKRRAELRERLVEEEQSRTRPGRTPRPRSSRWTPTCAPAGWPRPRPGTSPAAGPARRPSASSRRRRHVLPRPAPADHAAPALGDDHARPVVTPPALSRSSLHLLLIARRPTMSELVTESGRGDDGTCMIVTEGRSGVVGRGGTRRTCRLLLESTLGLSACPASALLRERASTTRRARRSASSLSTSASAAARRARLCCSSVSRSRSCSRRRADTARCHGPGLGPVRTPRDRHAGVEHEIPVRLTAGKFQEPPPDPLVEVIGQALEPVLTGAAGVLGPARPVTTVSRSSSTVRSGTSRRSPSARGGPPHRRPAPARAPGRRRRNRRSGRRDHHGTAFQCRPDPANHVVRPVGGERRRLGASAEVGSMAEEDLAQPHPQRGGAPFAGQHHLAVRSCSARSRSASSLA